MKTKLFLNTGIIILITMIAILGCNEDKEENNQNVDISLTKDNANAEVIINNITNIADLAYDEAGKFFKDGFPYSQCATLTFDNTSTPPRIIVDFGEDNCLCVDLRYRRGIIYVEYTGSYLDQGSMRHIYTENYYVNNNEVILDKSVTTEGLNNAGNYYFSISENCTINWEEGGSLIWESEREREWLEGSDTPLNIIDDVYLISGTATGSRPDGQTYTQVITNPLRIEVSCSNIVSGTIEITPEGEPVRILDYGEGECDRIATITVLGYTFTFLLW